MKTNSKVTQKNIAGAAITDTKNYPPFMGNEDAIAFPYLVFSSSQIKGKIDALPINTGTMHAFYAFLQNAYKAFKINSNTLINDNEQIPTANVIKTAIDNAIAEQTKKLLWQGSQSFNTPSALLNLGAISESISVGDVLEINYIPTYTGMRDENIRRLIYIVEDSAASSTAGTSDSIITYTGNNVRPSIAIQTYYFSVPSVSAGGNLSMSISSRGVDISSSGQLSSDSFSYGNPILKSVYKLLN